MSPLRKFLPLLLASLLASGCASVQTQTNNKDPLEKYNRAVYTFNDGFDRYLLKPVAVTYEEYVPSPIHNSISNLFSHLDDVVVIANDVLQLKFEQTLSDLGRFTFNSTFGLLGLFDVASHMDLPKHDEDFGQTLGRWGVGSGPYVELPFLGPSTLRDAPSLAADWQVDPIYTIDDDDTLFWSLLSLKAVDTRARLLRASRILDTAALDPYVFRRDAYMQRRNSLVYDGNPPQTELDEFDPFAEEPFDPLADEPPAPE